MPGERDAGNPDEALEIGAYAGHLRGHGGPDLVVVEGHRTKS
jgi:hypothetical protein